MRPITRCPCPTCPNLLRLTEAKAHFRALRAEHERLQDLLARHQRLPLRRYPQPLAQGHFGTQVWFENVVLRRLVGNPREAIAVFQQHIATLNPFVQDYDACEMLREHVERQARVITAFEEQISTLQTLVQFYEGHAPESQEVPR
jgi:hypothetical protein